MPKVSIVLPTYNGEEFLSNSIESVINQTFQDWELIIVNDCSTDNSLSIAEDYVKKDNRIKIINNDENKKLPESLNIGFREARGEYYTWTSDDNEYYPNAIEKMVNFLDINKSYGMVYAVCKTINIENDEVGRWGDIAITPVELLEGNIIGACFLYRSEVANIVGYYDKRHFLAEDHDYWLRLYKRSKIAHLEEELYFYRHHKNSLTAKKSKNAWYISRNLSVHYYTEYEQIFPAYASLIQNRWQLMQAIVNEDDTFFNQIKSKYSKRYIYKQLKNFNKIHYSPWNINHILLLGGIYFIKGFILFMKNR